MGPTVRTVVTTVCITSLIVLSYKAFSILFDYPTNQTHLESLNYRTIFDARKDQDSKWKSKYIFHTKELKKLIPEFNNINSNSEGGYVLKRWCEARLNENFATNKFEVFNMITKYCTMDIKSVITEYHDIKSIDDGTASEKRKTFDKLKHKLSGKGIQISNPEDKDAFKGFIKWCRQNLKLPYIPKNYYKLEEMQEYCRVID